MGSFTVLLNGNPYFGDLESIPITVIPTIITINVVPVNPGTLTEFNYTFYLILLLFSKLLLSKNPFGSYFTF